MARTAAARAFENMAGIVDTLGRLHLGDLRSVHVWAMVRVAAAAVRRPAGQSGRDIYRGYRYRSWAACCCAVDVPVDYLGIEARSPQPTMMPCCPNVGLSFFLGSHLGQPLGMGVWPAPPGSIPNGGPSAPAPLICRGEAARLGPTLWRRSSTERAAGAATMQMDRLT